MPRIARVVVLAVFGALLCAPTGAHAALPYTRDVASQANITFTGAAVGDNAGKDISSAGDLNGDGRGDLYVGAWKSDLNGTDSGVVYVIFGQASATNVDLAQPLGAKGYRIVGSGGEQLGHVIEKAGDVNGDGVEDALVAADGMTYNGRSKSGGAYVIYGKATTGDVGTASLGNAGYKIGGVAANDITGSWLTALGDVNGDSIPDQAVTAWKASATGRPGSGKVYVIFGKRNQATIDLKSLGSGGYEVVGSASSAELGETAANAGDVNGDGADDLVIGEDEDSFSNRSGSGSAFVVFGKATTATVDTAALAGAGYRIGGALADQATGRSVGNAGDVNGDGVPDQVISADTADYLGRADSGLAYIVYGQRGSASQIDLASLGSNGYVIGGAAAANHFGQKVAGLGDINGDSIPDQLIGAGDATFSTRAKSGASYVIYGRRGAIFPIDTANLGTQGYVIGGAAAADNLGFESGRSVGDVNGDGRADIGVGAYMASPAGRTSAGAGYVIYSDPSPPVSSLSHNAVTGPGAQLFDAPTGKLFYNPSSNGSFTLANGPTDQGSGVVAVDYPALTTTGFSGAATTAQSAPWTSGTYSFTSANTTAPAPFDVTVSDGQGNRTKSTITPVRDASGPTTTIAAPNAVRTSTPLSATAEDGAGAGTETVEFRYCAGSSCSYAASTAIATDSAAPYEASWPAQPADGTHTLLVRATDRLGNYTDTTKTLTVDNTNPTLAALSLAEGARGDLQYFDSTAGRLYYNPIAAGNFTVSTTPADSGGSGIASVAFDGMLSSDTGWSGAAKAPTSTPFTSNVYGFSTAATTAAATKTVTARDAAGNTASRPLAFTRDSTGPITTLTAPAAARNGVALSATANDAASGTDHVDFRYSAGSSYNAAASASIGSDATGPFTASWSGQPPDGTYTVAAVSTDRVGNTSTATKTIRVDNSGPQGRLALEPGAGADNQYLDATRTTLFYNPVTAGDLRLSAATSTDASGLASVDFPQISTQGFTGAAATASASPWTSAQYSFDTANATAPADAAVTLTDTLGNTSQQTLHLVRDTTAPAGGSVSYPGRSSGPVAVTVHPGSDAGSGIKATTLERQEAPLTRSGCGSFATPWVETAATDQTTTTGHCYRYRYRVQDRVGNSTTYGGTSILRRTAPSAPPTRRPPAKRPPKAQPPAGQPPKGHIAAVPVRVLSRSVTLDRKGRAPIKVRCGRGAGPCRGRITLFYFVKAKPRKSRKGRAAIATTSASKRTRRRKIVLASKRYDVRPGASKTILVKVSRHARRRALRKHKRVRCRISVTAGNQKSTRSLVLKRGRSRR